MKIFELSKLTPLLSEAFINDCPFVYHALPSTWATGSYWTTAFGAPEESATATINITSLVRDSTVVYSRVLSLADCIVTEQSFYWNAGTQELHVHVEHDVGIDGHLWKYGLTFGYCDKKACYISGFFYAPILKSIPSLAQKQDLIGHNKLATISGTVVLQNVGGYIDEIVDESFYGYDCFVGYLDDDERDDYDRSEIIYLAALYVDDLEASPSEISLKVQDRRKSGNIKIPTVLFDSTTYPNAEDSVIGKPIPLAFGALRIVPTFCTNGKTTTGAVSFRVAESLTAIGTVQIKKGDVWTTVATASVDLATGSFTLASGVGRDGSGNIYEARVLGCTGIAVVHSSDIIKYLNLTFLDVLYTESEYDKEEWEEAEAELETAALYVGKQIDLAEAIRQIQAGSNVGFRYEFKGDDRRTIRINDFERLPTARICVEDILDPYELGFFTDKAELAASVKIGYAKDYTDDSDEAYLSVTDSTQYETVKEEYRQMPQLEFPTLLPTAALAAARAAVDALHYGTMRKHVSVEGMGKDFLGLRVYDTLTIEATPGFVDADFGTIEGDREWLGIWSAQVLESNPDLDNIKNKLELVLIEKQEEVAEMSVLADADGRYIRASANENRFLRIA
jgi:hypothetical protein